MQRSRRGQWGCETAPSRSASGVKAVGAVWARDSFDSQNGLPLLQRQFSRVERLIRGGTVMWLDAADLQAYLDAYRELLGVLHAPEGPYPFVATRAKCIFVAEAA